MIGAYGFGYTHVGGQHVLSAQLGYVRIGNDVEIGAGTTIDRGTYGATSIGDGTKIDNQVQIAHNCRIGRHNLICAQVGIAGSTTTGDYVVMGGQAGLRDHVHIGTGARLSAMAGITNDVPDGARHAGHSGHARARSETETGGPVQAARDAARIQSDSPRGCRSAKSRLASGPETTANRIKPHECDRNELVCSPPGAGIPSSWPKLCAAKTIT